MKLHIPEIITLHCTASPNGRDCSVEKIRDLHKAPTTQVIDWFGKKVHGMDFDDVGYHWVIQPDGLLEVGRPEDIRGAHVGGANTGNVGIAMAGTDKFTTDQFDVLRSLVGRIQTNWDIFPWVLYGHYEFDSAKAQGKRCPNMDIKRIIYWLASEDWRAIEGYVLK